MNSNYIATEQEADKFNTNDLLQFSRGYIDATSEEDAFQYVFVTHEMPFKLVIANVADTHYAEDLPHKIREQNWYAPKNPTTDDLIEEFESSGWTYEGTNNEPI